MVLETNLFWNFLELDGFFVHGNRPSLWASCLIYFSTKKKTFTKCKYFFSYLLKLLCFNDKDQMELQCIPILTRMWLYLVYFSRDTVIICLTFPKDFGLCEIRNWIPVFHNLIWLSNFWRSFRKKLYVNWEVQKLSNHREFEIGKLSVIIWNQSLFKSSNFISLNMYRKSKRYQIQYHWRII